MTCELNNMLSVADLEFMGACPDQLRLLTERFGTSPVRVTRALCEANADGPRWDWAAAYLLPPAALAEYDLARHPAYAKYKSAFNAALDEYSRTRCMEYDKCKRVTALARAEYDRARASEFGRLVEVYGFAAQGRTRYA